MDFSENDKNLMELLKNSINSTIDYQVGELEQKEGKNIYRVWQGDGIYEVRENNIGKFVMKMTDANFPGIKGSLKQGFTAKFPKIPYSVYTDILEFFRYMYTKMKSEVYVRVYYSPSTDEFYYRIPVQYVGPARAKWVLGDDQLERGQEDLFVLQVHSHHTMHGKFSSIDDEDQVSLESLHLVIGNIFSVDPETHLRFTLDKKKVNLFFDEIFEEPKTEPIDLSAFPGWDSKIFPIEIHPDNLKKVSLEKEDGQPTLTGIVKDRKKNKRALDKDVIKVTDAKEFYNPNFVGGFTNEPSVSNENSLLAEDILTGR